MNSINFLYCSNGEMGNFTKSTPQDFQTHNYGWSSLPPHQREVNIHLLFWLTNLFKLCPMFVPNLVKIGQKFWPLQRKHTGYPTTPLLQQYNDLSALAPLEMYFYDLPNEGLHKRGILTDLDLPPTAPSLVPSISKSTSDYIKNVAKARFTTLCILKVEMMEKVWKGCGTPHVQSLLGSI